MNFIKTHKKLITVACIVIMVLALPVILVVIRSSIEIRQRAAGGTVNVTTQIPAGSKNVNTDFTTDLKFDTQGNNVTAYDLTFKFDKNILQAVSVSTYAPYTLVSNSITQETGTIHLVGITKSPQSGVITVGKVTFKGIASGTSTLSYSDIKIAAAGSGSTNITSSQQAASVTIESAQPLTTCSFTTSNVIPLTAGASKSFNIQASKLPAGTTDVGFTSGTDKLFKDFNKRLEFNPTMALTINNSSYSNTSAGGSQSFSFNLSTSTQTPVGKYTLDAIYLSNAGTKTQCIFSGLGGLVIDVSAPAGTKTCYKDADGDGFGNASGGTLTNQTTCSSGWALTNNDCYDTNPGAYPGQPGYFGVHRGDNSFDYDCSNGTIEKKYAKNSFNQSQTATCFPNMPSGTVGFTNETACGATSTFRLCYRWTTPACGGGNTAINKSESIGQTCPTGTTGSGWALVDGGSVQQQCK